MAFVALLVARFYNSLLVGFSLQFDAKIDPHVFTSKESNSDPLIYREYCNNYGVRALNWSIFKDTSSRNLFFVLLYSRV